MVIRVVGPLDFGSRDCLDFGIPNLSLDNLIDQIYVGRIIDGNEPHCATSVRLRNTDLIALTIVEEEALHAETKAEQLKLADDHHDLEWERSIGGSG
jgi:hypothetical protein